MVLKGPDTGLAPRVPCLSYSSRRAQGWRRGIAPTAHSERPRPELASDTRVQASLHSGVDAGSSRCRNGASLCQSSQNATVPAQFPLWEKTLIVRQRQDRQKDSAQFQTYSSAFSQRRAVSPVETSGPWVGGCCPVGARRPGRTTAGRTGTTRTGPRAALTCHPTAPSSPPEAPGTNSRRRGRDVTVAGQTRDALGPPPADPAASSPPPRGSGNQFSAAGS